MIIYGKNPLKAVIANKHEIYKLYLDNKFNDQKFLAFLKEHHIYYDTLAKDQLNTLTNNGLHQGVVADIAPYQSYDLKTYLQGASNTHVVVLDQLSDPHNLGSIIRTTNALGLDAIIMAKNNQVALSGVVAKVASGALEYVKIITVSNINQALLTLKNNGYTVVGSSDKASLLYTELPPKKMIAMVVGQEGSGMRKLVMDNCDYLVKIPMAGKISSLNVGVAFGILGYQLLKK